MAGADYYVYMFMADLVVFALTIIFFDDFSGQLDQDLAFVRPHPAWPRVRVPAPWRRARRRHCPDLIGPVYAPELPGGGGWHRSSRKIQFPRSF